MRFGLSYHIFYTCKQELLPVVEGVLAAHGYNIEIPPQPDAAGTTALVMSDGATTVLLTSASAREVAEIKVWGIAQSAVAQLIESLPIALR
jgi:hypothetical protein